MLAEAVIGIETCEIDEGGVLARNERRDAMKKEVLKARAPAVGPQMLERGDNAGSGQRPALGRDSGRGVEADRLLGLAGVEVTHVINASAWDGVENVCGKIAVRVNDGDAFSRIDVVHGEIEQERALARA
jgi:hypothetical protein